LIPGSCREGTFSSLRHLVLIGSGATHTPVIWVPVALSPTVKLTTELQLVPRLRMCGTVPPHPK